VAATRESESDRAHVRFSDLLMCADLTDLRSTNQPNSSLETQDQDGKTKTETAR